MSDKVKVITDPEAIKALSDATRIKILRTMQRLQPVSATELAEELGESAPKISYHLKLLEKHEIIYLAETRTKGNLLEHLYAPTADMFTIHRDLSAQNDAEFSEAIMQTVQQIIAMLTSDLMRLPYIKETVNFESTAFFGVYYLTADEIKELEGLVRDKLVASRGRKPGPGLYECNVGFQLIDAQSIKGDQDEK